MPPAFKLGGHKSTHDLFSCVERDEAGGDTYDICVVVFPSQRGQFLQPTYGRAYAGMLVSRNGYSVGAAAYEYALLVFALFYGRRYRMGKVRIVGRLRRVRPEIRYFMASLLQECDQCGLIFKPGVIASNCYFHNARFFCCRSMG